MLMLQLLHDRYLCPTPSVILEVYALYYVAYLYEVVELILYQFFGFSLLYQFIRHLSIFAVDLLNNDIPLMIHTICKPTILYRKGIGG